MTTDSATTTPSLNQKPSYSFPRFNGSSTEVVHSAPPPKTIQINAPSSQPEEPILEHADENLDKFEEVGLNDPKPKHRGIFARWGNTSTTAEEKERPNSNTSTGMMGHSFFGRKRGQSGVGSELGAMNKPGARPVSSGRQAANSVSSVQSSQTQTPSRTQTPVPATAVAAPPPAPAAPATAKLAVATPAAAPAPAVSTAPLTEAQQAKVDA